MKNNRLLISTQKGLKEIRKKLGVSQEKMGRLLGCSFISVNRWETGWSLPPTGVTLDFYLAMEIAQGRRRTRDLLTAYTNEYLTVDGNRGKFLLRLFSLAYGPASKGPTQRLS